MPEPSHWTAVMFLRATAEFVRLVPERERWNEEALRDNPPRLVRFRRLQALARAFDIQPGFAALLDGSFIESRPDTEYAALKAFLDEEVQRRRPASPLPLRPGWSSFSGGALYRTLAKYVMHAYDLLA